MESIWSKTCEIEPRGTLSADIETEVAVIGAGMAGVLIANLLLEAGKQVVVLEANTIGSGQTRGTTAKITAQHGLIYDSLITDVGEEKARQYANANSFAIKQFAQMIDDNGIDCDFERKSAYLYSIADDHVLKKEAEAAAKLGLEADFVKDIDLPFPVAGVVRFANQAQFHPLKFMKAIAEKLTIYEHTPVLSVEEDVIKTTEHTIRAKHIVFASHFPFINMPGYYFTRMHQSRAYMLALQNVMQPDSMYISADEDGYTLRSYKDYLLFGGGDHRTGENSLGGRYEFLRKAAKEYFPTAAEAACWSAQDCMTLDSVPYIGHFSNSTPNWYVATGFMKWGMSSSMVAATLLRDLICGIPNKNAEVFSPQRFNFASVPEFLKDSVQSVKGLVREKFTIPQKTLDDLPAGHGGVVESNGEKVGVYKNEQGETFVVDVRCSHLGCQLEWNPDEKSWDCPCHGSRFDYTGHLLNNPAQSDVSFV